MRITFLAYRLLGNRTDEQHAYAGHPLRRGAVAAYAACWADDEAVPSAFSTVTPRPDEVAADRPGDDLVAGADVVMDRAFTLDTSRETLWPWVIQLGKQRAGWYLPRSVERFVPRSRRAARSLDPAWQGLVVGDVIPDYGGRHETLAVAVLSAPSTLVYTSVRGRMSVSWSINLTEASPTAQPGPTRVHLRLRLGHVRRPWLAESGGDLIDLLTVAGLAAGLRERVAP